MLLIYSLTILPLVITPGPDMLFVASQAMAGGVRAGLRATGGVMVGYCIHSLGVALGLAAVLASFPLVFELIRWAGIVYLLYIAVRLLRSALSSNGLQIERAQHTATFWRGVITSLLNPKVILLYIAILPQFMDQHAGNLHQQALTLSAIFMLLCGVTYTAVSILAGQLNGSQLSDQRARKIDGTAGFMVLVAAGLLAITSSR